MKKKRSWPDISLDAGRNRGAKSCLKCRRLDTGLVSTPDGGVAVFDKPKCLDGHEVTPDAAKRCPDFKDASSQRDQKGGVR